VSENVGFADGLDRSVSGTDGDLLHAERIMAGDEGEKLLEQQVTASFRRRARWMELVYNILLFDNPLPDT